MHRTYDSLGRVRSTEVLAGAGSAAKARQSFDFDATSDARRARTDIEGLPAHELELAYDLRHQLAGVWGNAGYKAELGYTADGCIEVPHRSDMYRMFIHSSSVPARRRSPSIRHVELILPLMTAISIGGAKEITADSSCRALLTQ